MTSNSSSPNFENGYALLIGVNYYHWRQYQLHGTVADINDLYEHFTHPRKAAYNKNNIISLKEEDATRKNILSSLDILIEKAAADKDATVLIYFSGHGAVSGEHNFLVPYDFDLDQYQQQKSIEGISVVLSTEFGQKINKINAKKCLVILDCCHAENMTNTKSFGQKSLGFITDEIEEIFDKSSIDSSVANVVKSGRGKVILTSCEADEESLDMGSNGLFTKVLLECLSGENNIEKDGWVRLTDMMRYIPKTVKQRALERRNHQQNPVFKRIENLSSEDFILCAYDIAKAKGIQSEERENQKPQKTNNDDLETMVTKGQVSQVFKELNQIESLQSNPQYHRLKAEFTAGLQGINLIDFQNRLKVFIDSNI